VKVKVKVITRSDDDNCQKNDAAHGGYDQQSNEQPAPVLSVVAHDVLRCTLRIGFNMDMVYSVFIRLASSSALQ